MGLDLDLESAVGRTSRRGFLRSALASSAVMVLAAPGHTPGHQALLVSFDDGARFACVGDAAYTLQAVIEHRPTGRPTDEYRAVISLQRLTDLDAQLLTAHDIDQWRDVSDASLIHSA